MGGGNPSLAPPILAVARRGKKVELANWARFASYIFSKERTDQSLLKIDRKISNYDTRSQREWRDAMWK